MAVLGGTMKKIKKIRPILQMEATECGAASLAMILDYYGKTVTLEELRRECGVSRNGVNAKNIVKAARFHNLKPRAVRVDIAGAKSLKTPAVIHWNMDHFLVLCGFHGKGAVLADPAYGLRTVSMEEFSKAFTGIAIELTPTEEFQKNRGSNTKDYISSCVKALIPNIVYFILIELCVLAGTGAMLFLNSVFIDKILIGGNVQNLAIILRILLCAGLITASAIAINKNISHRIGKHLNVRINSGFIEHLLKLPIEFFLQRNEGDLANRQNANMRMGGQLVELLSPIPGYILQIAVYWILIFVFDVHIALIGILCAVVNMISILKSSKRYEEKMRSYNRDIGVLQGDISRAVDMIETIKSCGAEDAMFARLMAAGTLVVNKKTEIGKTGIYTSALFQFLDALGSGAVLIAGVWEILSGHMSTGILIVAQSLVAVMLAPVGSVVNTGIEMQALKSETARTNDVMHYAQDSKFLDAKNRQTEEIDGDIELQNVSFGYSPLDEPFVKNYYLRIKKGGVSRLPAKAEAVNPRSQK